MQTQNRPLQELSKGYPEQESWLFKPHTAWDMQEHLWLELALRNWVLKTKNFGGALMQEECSRAGLLSLLASHWFKAFVMKHSESLSLLLCKNYPDKIVPDCSWCYFSFVWSLLPISNTKRLKSMVHQMRWKWGLENSALTGMKKGLFSSGVCSLRTTLCCNMGLSLAPDASQHKTQHVLSVPSIYLAGCKLLQRCS